MNQRKSTELMATAVAGTDLCPEMSGTQRWGFQMVAHEDTRRLRWVCCSRVELVGVVTGEVAGKGVP